MLYEKGIKYWDIGQRVKKFEKFESVKYLYNWQNKQKMKITINKHPDLDFFIGRFDEHQVPTKQDKFKPMTGYEFVITESDGTQSKIHDHDIYIRKKSENNLKKFEDEFIKLVKENMKEEHPYKKSEKLEVIISVSIDEKRLETVDVDNLARQF